MAAMKVSAAVILLTCLIAACQGDSCAPNCAVGSTSLYPHPKDCTKFYQCSYGTSFQQVCPSGLHFNPVGQYCDYPAQAGCTADPDLDCGENPPTSPTEEPGTKPPPPITEAPSSGPDSTPEVIQTTPEVDSCVPPCPSPEALYPHPHDCTKYFHCAYNVPYLKPCPPGQEYWGEKERCDFPNIAQCNANPSNPCIAVTAPTTPPEPTVTEPSVTGSPPEPECKPPCPHSEAYMAHPQDCNKFYICANFIAFETHCQPGLEYSVEGIRCDYPELAKCTAGPHRACDEVLS